MDGYDKDQEAFHIPEHNDKKALSAEPVEEYGGEEERQIGEDQHQVLQPAEVILLVAIFGSFLGEHLDKQLGEGSKVAF